jgi:hypothetical protein
MTLVNAPRPTTTEEIFSKLEIPNEGGLISRDMEMINRQKGLITTIIK